MNLLRPLLALLLGGALCSCAIGAPPGFSDGDTWGFPLVGPLEQGIYLTPVKINGKGPWLFAIDPDLGVSAVDAGIQTELQLLPEPGIQVLNQDDHLKPFARARVNEIALGDLTVRNRVVFVKPPMTIRGRWVRGVLGRDVIAPSLIFSIDRDRGMGYLSTQGHLKPPPEAKKIEYRLVRDRFLAKVKLNDKHEAVMHLDVGNGVSSLWAAKQKEFGLPRIPKQSLVRDEFGFSRETDTVGIAAKVKIGEIQASGVELTPMVDQRIQESAYDGEIGQTFFFPYNLVINWHHTTFWLKERTQDIVGTAKERMRRWGSRFDTCAFAACVKIELDPVGGVTCPEPAATTGDSGDPASADADADSEADPTPAAPTAAECVAKAPDMYQLRIGREAMAKDLEYEITFLAVNEEGVPIGSNALTASLPRGAETVFHPITDASYANAKAFLVVDMSPFPRPCDKVGGGYRCVWAAE